MKKPLLIGVSARIYYPRTSVLDVSGVWTKTLNYLEQSVAIWLMHAGALPVMIPAVDGKSLMKTEHLDLAHYADAMDGLVLQGGNDVSPESYGEKPLAPEWAGDPVRDSYETDLLKSFFAVGKPIFGICRGMQLINVAFGGSLWQDLPSQRPGPVHHRHDRRYEYNSHAVSLQPGGWLSSIMGGSTSLNVNSIHHQGIKDLAPDFCPEALCGDDGLVEAIRHRDEGRFLAGVQWHPEFHSGSSGSMSDDRPILYDFLEAAARFRATHR